MRPSRRYRRGARCSIKLSTATSKAEATEAKLYSLVKAGVREFDFVDEVLGTYQIVTQAIGSDSIDGLKRTLPREAALAR